MPWELVYSSTHALRAEAQMQENRIKKRGARRFLLDRLSNILNSFTQFFGQSPQFFGHYRIFSDQSRL
jgi:hypothetical protein